jgi:spore coat polysaccharide biosynthesis protein SpsF
MDLAGEPMLVRCINRVVRCKLLDQIVIATTEEPVDDAIVDLCNKRGWYYFRGSELDVLDRYYQAAKLNEADVVVRITSDCPIIESDVIDQVVHDYLEKQPGVDYTSNTTPTRTFPRGLDTEVMRFSVLEQIWKEDNNPSWREHVTPYIHHHPELFRCHGVMNDKDLSHMRWTVDTPEDLTLIRKIYEEFDHDQFSWQEVLNLLENHPEWLDINRNIQQKIVK